MLNPNLTQGDAKWLVEEFAPHMGWRIDGGNMDKYWVPARALMLGRKVERPGCGCEFKAYVAMTNSMYGQHEAAIKEIAYPKVETVTKTSRGRKTVQEVSTDTTIK